jgi:hypothetical protein
MLVVGVPAALLTHVGADFLKRVYGPELDVVGERRRAERLRKYEANQISVIEEAAAGMNAAEIVPAEVSPKLLVPILSYAGYEDNDELRHRWAALLANVANPRTPRLVHPSFPAILAELTPVDASYLYLLKQKHIDDATGDYVKWLDFEEVYFSTTIEREDGLVAIHSLIRQGLIEREPAIKLDDSNNAYTTNQRGVGITPFGHSFLAACEMPKM